MVSMSMASAKSPMEAPVDSESSDIEAGPSEVALSVSMGSSPAEAGDIRPESVIALNSSVSPLTPMELPCVAGLWDLLVAKLVPESPVFTISP